MLLSNDSESPLTKGWVLNALAKLSLRVTDVKAN
jgi:hypothetical protein